MPKEKNGRTIKKIRINKKAIAIFFSNGERIDISEEAYTSSYLYVGKELSDKEIAKLTQITSVKKLSQYALSLLSKHHYTEWKMREKLYAKGGSKDDVDYIISKLKELDLINDKEFIEEHNQEIYQNVIDLEKAFLKICSLLPDIYRTYVVTDENKEKVETLKQTMNALGTTKQSLDNYVHSSLKQPFSTLKGKLDELSHQYDLAKAGMEEFKQYVDFLKNSSEEAYTLVFVYYYRLKQVEQVLREIAIADFSEPYLVRIEDCYDVLNEIDKAIKVQPIAVDAINEKVSSLKSNANALFEEVENKYREMQLAESAVVYANRDRNHQEDVHQQLSA